VHRPRPPNHHPLLLLLRQVLALAVHLAANGCCTQPLCGLHFQTSHAAQKAPPVSPPAAAAVAVLLLLLQQHLPLLLQPN
jgi:hypothetical protein